MTATPNPDPDEGRNRRRWSRYDVDGPFPATLITEDGRVACRIENVSLTGARVRTAAPVPPPTRIRLNYGRQSAADGRCIWWDAETIGLSFGLSEDSVALALACLRPAAPDAASDTLVNSA